MVVILILRGFQFVIFWCKQEIQFLVDLKNDRICDVIFIAYGVEIPESQYNIHRTILAIDNNAIVGAVILNNTGMGGFIPENILVYIAVDNSQRGKGYGKSLMQKAISVANGDIALHVEPNNPAKKLYEKLGFTNKYLEMRLIK